MMTLRHHSQPPMRKLLAASLRSPGNAAAPATTLNGISRSVPAHEGREPDVGAEVEVDDCEDEGREQEVGGEGGEELCEGLCSSRPDGA